MNDGPAGSPVHAFSRSPVREFSLPVTTHGRVLTDDTVGPARRLFVALHGYKESAGDAFSAARAIPGVAGEWRVVAPQGLHRFYASGDRVVASWMTKQDRELAIADNVAYIDAVVEEAVDDMPAGAEPVIVYAGFSQGAAMAYRAAVLGRYRASGIIALAADMPPELRQSDGRQPWPPVLIGVGDAETWYTPDKLAADAAFLESRGILCEVCRFQGGHEWTDEFRATAGRWLAAL